MQEWLWRAIFATLLIQCVWLVWDMAKRLPHAERFAVAATWLFSAAMIMQAGTIMFATITAVQALVFLWILFAQENGNSVADLFSKKLRHIILWIRGTNDSAREEWKAFWVAVLWLASLFTAYQILLFIPIVIAVFAGLPVSRAKKIFYFCAPLVALVLFTAASPLIIASFAIHGGKDASASFFLKGWQVVWLCVLAGSFFGSLLGAWGIVRSRSVALILSFLLVILATFMSWQPYYAILFAPLLVGGLMHYFHLHKLRGFPYAPLIVCTTVVLVGIGHPWRTSSPSREAMSVVNREAIHSGSLLIYGSFGHDWQYESDEHAVRHYTAEGFAEASALVCTSNCDAIRKEGMSLVTDQPMEIWVR